MVSKEEIAEDLHDATEAVLALLRRVKPEVPSLADKDNVLSITTMLESTK